MLTMGGKPLIRATKLRINLTLTQSQSRGLIRVANRDTVTRDEVIGRAINEFLERDKAK